MIAQCHWLVFFNLPVNFNERSKGEGGRKRNISWQHILQRQESERNYGGNFAVWNRANFFPRTLCKCGKPAFFVQEALGPKHGMGPRQSIGDRQEEGKGREREAAGKIFNPGRAKQQQQQEMEKKITIPGAGKIWKGGGGGQHPRWAFQLSSLINGDNFFPRKACLEKQSNYFSPSRNLSAACIKVSPFKQLQLCTYVCTCTTGHLLLHQHASTFVFPKKEIPHARPRNGLEKIQI